MGFSKQASIEIESSSEEQDEPHTPTREEQAEEYERDMMNHVEAQDDVWIVNGTRRKRELAEARPDLDEYFRQFPGLTVAQKASICSGYAAYLRKTVATNSRTFLDAVKRRK